MAPFDRRERHRSPVRNKVEKEFDVREFLEGAKDAFYIGRGWERAPGRGDEGVEG